MSASPPQPERLVGLRHLTWALLAVLVSAFGTLIGCIAHVLAPRRGRLAAWVASLWGRAIVTAAGGRMIVEGTEHIDANESRMLVANHASFLDPPAVLGAFPTNVRIVMKQEVRKLPFIGFYVQLTGHLLIDRERSRSGMSLITEFLGRAKKETVQFLVFPEGTRSADGRLQPMKAGSFQLAIEGNLPVQPVAITGTHAIMPKHSWGPRRSGTIRMRVGEPIPTEGLEGSRGRKVLAEKVREAFLALGVPDGTRETVSAT